MAIAFRPPEIIANAAAAPTNPSVQYTHYTTTTSSVPPPVVHHQSPMQSVTVQGPHTGGFVILSPSSAVIQHQGLWVSSSPQTVAAQQQMFGGGFPPIYHNNTATVPAPQFHRVAYAMTTTAATPAPPPAATTQRTPLAPQRESLLHRCVTAAGCCTTCNDIRRGK